MDSGSWIWQRIDKVILPILRKAMPPLSLSEREALEVGAAGWESTLFNGRPDWESLLAIQSPSLPKNELDFLNGQVEEFCAMLDDWKITNDTKDLSQEAWKFIRENGFFGMNIPVEYGGLDFSAFALSSIITKIASRSATAAVAVMVPNTLGPAKLLLRYGTDSQKKYYLPRLASGEEVPCFAVTNPEAGSDITGMPDHGVICRGNFNGKEALGIRLNCEKRYITLAPIATIMAIAFKLYDPEHLIGDQNELGISLALVPTNLPGVEVGSRHLPLNLTFLTGPIRCRDVFIPLEMIIGGKENAGRGLRMIMDCLIDGRAISLTSLSAGVSKLTCRVVGAYARIRKQFNTPIGKFEGVEELIARMAARTYGIEATRTLVTSLIDRGDNSVTISAIAKYQLTEESRRIVNDAMDILGGKGICLGPKNLIGRIYQALPIAITVEGSNIITRSLLIFGQGLINCHPYVRKILSFVSDVNANKKSTQLTPIILNFSSRTIINICRCLFHGLTRGLFTAVPVSEPSLRVYYRRINLYSLVFSVIVDLSLLFIGGKLKRREKLSGRLSDILGRMLVVSAVLKRFNDQQNPKEDLPIVHLVCRENLSLIQKSLDEFVFNFPVKSASYFFRSFIFLFIHRLHIHSDQLDNRVASLVLEPTLTRDRLTDGIFIPKNSNEPLNLLEDALKKIVNCSPIDKRLREAQKKGLISGFDNYDDAIKEAVDCGIIGVNDASLLYEARKIYLEVIKVDEFDYNFSHNA